MHSSHIQEVNRNTPVSPVNSDEQYYLVDVVSFILLYLKDRLYDFLNMTDLKMSQVEFDWVVTVPAIWDARGKQMMREAAYKVINLFYVAARFILGYYLL